MGLGTPLPLLSSRNGFSVVTQGNPWSSPPKAAVAGEPCCHGGPKMTKIGATSREIRGNLGKCKGFCDSQEGLGRGNRVRRNRSEKPLEFTAMGRARPWLESISATAGRRIDGATFRVEHPQNAAGCRRPRTEEEIGTPGMRWRDGHRDPRDQRQSPQPPVPPKRFS